MCEVLGGCQLFGDTVPSVWPFGRVTALCGLQALQGDIPVSRARSPAQAWVNQGTMVTPHFYSAPSQVLVQFGPSWKSLVLLVAPQGQ